MSAPDRILHLVTSHADYTAACRDASDAPGAAHWILGFRSPRAELVLPANVECIRLPDPAAASAGPDEREPAWWPQVWRLIEELRPARVNAHRSFGIRWPRGLAELRMRLEEELEVRLGEPAGDTPPEAATARRPARRPA